MKKSENFLRLKIERRVLLVSAALLVIALMLAGLPIWRGAQAADRKSASPATAMLDSGAVKTSADKANLRGDSVADNRQQATEAFGRLPLYFVENHGQMDARVAYYVQGYDKTLYFTSEGLSFALANPSKSQTTAKTTKQSTAPRPKGERKEPAATERYTLKLDFVGANPNVRPQGQEQTEAVFSYFKGRREQWQTGLKTYAGVVYQDLWPGIDLIYSGTVNQLKYRFVVHPGADPEQINLLYRGAKSLRLNAAGQLEVETPAGAFQDEQPISYQEIDGLQVPVASAYRLGGRGLNKANGYGFAVGNYDRNRELIIDPAVLIYAGYIGGSELDSGQGIAVDSAGNAYVTGFTDSNQMTFPVTVGPDLTKNVRTDAFVAKVKADGTALLYCGYIGGSQTDVGFAIAVDSAGNAYVTGQTESDETTFPVVGGPDTTFNGLDDTFVAKVNAAGTALVYSGYIGGNGIEGGKGIAVDGAGNAYITGGTGPNSTGFPVAIGPDVTANGDEDAYVAKVKADGTGLVYCGYIGGSGIDEGRGIAVDGAGNAYVTGTARSDQFNFPVTIGPDLTYNGATDAFVAKVNATGTGLLYCGYIGGDNIDEGNGIAVDSAGNAYITGSTQSDQSTFPVKIGPSLLHKYNQDAFVTKVNAAGTMLVYCGYIGGTGQDFGAGIAVDCAGYAFVTGRTFSNEMSFPVTVGPDLSSNGDEDAYVAKIQADGTGLVYCGFIGGLFADEGQGIAVDSNSNAYITGFTLSNQMSFPVTAGPDLSHNGSGDAFVAKIALTPVTCPSNITKSNDVNQCGAVASFPVPCGSYTCSPVSGSFFPIGTTTVTCTPTTGAACVFTVTIQDTQSPTISCPANIIAKTGTIGDPCAAVNFTTSASDNCPGLTVGCVPPSGSCFPVGTTTVTCTATDASGNKATCNFTATVFDGCIQDDTNPSLSAVFNTRTGDYIFCCSGVKYSGRGVVTVRGSTYTLQHTASDRRVTLNLDSTTNRAAATYQRLGAGAMTCTVNDRDIRNDTCPCATQ